MLEDIDSHSTVTLLEHMNNANGDTCDLILRMDFIINLSLVTNGEVKRLKWISKLVPVIKIIKPMIDCRKEKGKPSFTSITQVQDELVRKQAVTNK